VKIEFGSDTCWFVDNNALKSIVRNRSRDFWGFEIFGLILSV
jgi:hypothetical protein